MCRIDVEKMASQRRLWNGSMTKFESQDTFRSRHFILRLNESKHSRHYSVLTFYLTFKGSVAAPWDDPRACLLFAPNDVIM